MDNIALRGVCRCIAELASFPSSQDMSGATASFDHPLHVALAATIESAHLKGRTYMVYARVVIADTNQVLFFCNQAMVEFLSILNQDASPNPKRQNHKATKREMRHRTNGPGS